MKNKKKLALLEAQLKNYEKFRNHSYLFGIQNEIKKMKINNYSNNYKKKVNNNPKSISNVKPNQNTLNNNQRKKRFDGNAKKRKN